ncbi:hypothetical protein RRF57_011079 [Xylaria bambusicola]|uniref:Uncharacterized protein n=1 Tax=Xylaria bambusicola TaxID=326684 RepID=A0AAN7UTB2_9PEZI
MSTCSMSEIQADALVDGIAFIAASAVTCINNTHIDAAIQQRPLEKAASARFLPHSTLFKRIWSTLNVPIAADTAAKSM